MRASRPFRDTQIELLRDPDNAALYRVETATGLRGTIVDAYGTYADEHLADFLRAVPVDED